MSYGHGKSLLSEGGWRGRKKKRRGEEEEHLAGGERALGRPGWTIILPSPV